MFCICENKGACQLHGDQRLCFRLIRSTFPHLPISSSNLLWLYSPVCIGPGRKPGERFIATRLIYHSTLPTQINKKFTELLDANLGLHLYGYVSIMAQITNHQFGVHLTSLPIRNYKTTDRSRVALLLQFSIFLVLMSDSMLSSPSICLDNI